MCFVPRFNDSVDAGNDRVSTHHCVVRVDDRRSRRSVGEHSEKGGDGYVVYHLHDGAHLSSFLKKKITPTSICNTHEKSTFSTIAGKFHANSITINRTVSKSNFPSGSHTIGYRLFRSLQNIRGIYSCEDKNSTGDFKSPRGNRDSTGQSIGFFRGVRKM